MAIGDNKAAQRQQRAAAPAGVPQPTAQVLETISTTEMPFWAAFRMAVIGPPAAGKTHLCLTASQKISTGVLDDILLVETDPLGLACAREQGFELPHVVDFSTFTDAEMSKAFTALPAYLAAEVIRTSVRAVCVDTASVLFGAVCVTETANHDGPRAYNVFAQRIRTFYSKLKAIAVPIIMTMHVRPPRVIMDNKGQFIADSASAAGIRAGALTMDVEGNKGANVIRAQSTLIGRLRKTEKPGDVVEHTVEFSSRTDETKRRFTRCIDKTEPADLSYIFRKIAEGCGQPPLGELAAPARECAG